VAVHPRDQDLVLAADRVVVDAAQDFHRVPPRRSWGGGTRALPDQVRLNLALAQEHRFGSGTVYLCYRPA
jgi:hypothetical protein